MRRAPAVLFFTALLVLACSGIGAKVDGQLLVDGQPFVADSCTSGQVHGFTGFQLRDAAGNAVRVVVEPDNTVRTILIDAGAATGTSLGSCGAAMIRRTGVQINNITALDGVATLSCAAEGRSVEGEVQISRCATHLFGAP